MTKSRYNCGFLRILYISIIIFLIGAAIITWSKTLLTKAEEPVPLPVIMYHSIYTDIPTEYAVTPKQIENDLQWLKNNGYQTVTSEQVIAYTQNRGTLPEKSVMITLDDGFYNNLSVLVPLLEKYDMTAVVSVVGSYIDNDAVKDPHNPKYSYLTWADINELVDSGRIEIGNHTYNMHSLYNGRTGCSINKGESEEEYRKALSEDIQRLQGEFLKNMGFYPVVFTYPFGSVSRESLPVIRDCGFLMTLTCREQMNYITREPDCLYGIGRYNRSGLYSTEEYMVKLFQK
ncbi:MAG: polysaccharide deacetylase family protein [Ruminococcus sp.]|nr:polysaccharide deacetylase family protein [Ruminococcus sp.]